MGILALNIIPENLLTLLQSASACFDKEHMLHVALERYHQDRNILLILLLLFLLLRMFATSGTYLILNKTRWLKSNVYGSIHLWTIYRRKIIEMETYNYCCCHPRFRFESYIYCIYQQRSMNVLCNTNLYKTTMLPAYAYTNVERATNATSSFPSECIMREKPSPSGIAVDVFHRINFGNFLAKFITHVKTLNIFTYLRYLYISGINW